MQCSTHGAMTMSDTSDARHGYNSALVAVVNARNSADITTRFAKLCIARGIPALKVADRFVVSKVTVYAWFKGTSTPRPAHMELMRSLLSEWGGGSA